MDWVPIFCFFFVFLLVFSGFALCSSCIEQPFVYITFLLIKKKKKFFSTNKEKRKKNVFERDKVGIRNVEMRVIK